MLLKGWQIWRRGISFTFYIALAMDFIRLPPFDVFRAHILPHLSISSHIACKFVCRQFRDYVVISLSKKQSIIIFKEIFEQGLLRLLKWFHSHLRYPFIPGDISMQFTILSLAAEGNLFFSSHFQLENINTEVRNPH